MRTIFYVLVPLLSVAAIPIAAQHAPREMFVSSVSTASSYSRIDTNADGQVILVSGYKEMNTKNNSVLQTERKYLGTPFLDDNWFTGELYINGNETLTGLMAFNVQKNRLYFMKSPQQEAIELKPKGFRLNNKTFYQYPAEGNGYFQTLIGDRPVKLLKQITCVYNPADPMQVVTGYETTKATEYEGEFKKKDEYYWLIDDKLYRLTPKKSSLKNIADLGNQPLKIAETNRIDLRKEADYVRLTDLLNAALSLN